MRRLKFQYSLRGLLLLTGVVAVGCEIAPLGVGIATWPGMVLFMLNLLVTGTIFMVVVYLPIVTLFEYLFPLHPANKFPRRPLPEKFELPQEVPHRPTIRRRRVFHSPTFWNPFGGYSKQ